MHPQELQGAKLELLMRDFREGAYAILPPTPSAVSEFFWGGGLRQTAPPPPPLPVLCPSLKWEAGGDASRPPENLCANPPLGRLSCVAPWGTISLWSSEGWDFTPPLHCRDPSPLSPRP